MSTRIYGASDDLIEIDGDVSGEVSSFGTDEQEHGVLVICSDGTCLEVKYGKGGTAIWSVTLLMKGSLFVEIEPCTDEDADPPSDVAVFRDGLKSAYAATEWQRMK